jgi:hypothetical protein
MEPLPRSGHNGDTPSAGPADRPTPTSRGWSIGRQLDPRAGARRSLYPPHLDFQYRHTPVEAGGDRQKRAPRRPSARCHCKGNSGSSGCSNWRRRGNDSCGLRSEPTFGEAAQGVAEHGFSSSWSGWEYRSDDHLILHGAMARCHRPIDFPYCQYAGMVQSLVPASALRPILFRG